MRWSDGLNPATPTYTIASSPRRHVRVLAGPGTGKSFAMRRRVTRLLESGLLPHQILPVTFTRVAAEDLHRELVGMNVPGCDELRGTTLHRLALQMLMRNHVLEATGRIPRPLNEFELEPMISDLAGKHGGKKRVKKKRLEYEAAWARLQSQKPGYSLAAEDISFQNSLVTWLRFHHAMLIGEVVPKLHEYLASNPIAGERSEYSHILVDEYQDLNRAEQEIIELLSQNGDVCVVGDDDQSVYSFKHAHPEGIREWTNTHAGADDVGLDECRRCPTRIVHMANSLIGHNPTRPVPRTLTAMPINGQGIVRIMQYKTIGEEVQGVAEFVANALAQGAAAGEILVLAQSRALGMRIFQALVERSISTRSYYAESELSETDTQRRFALLKLLANREDRVALRWLVGVGSGTWNAAGYRRIREHSEHKGLSPWDTMTLLERGALRLPYTASVVSCFANVVQELNTLAGLSDLEAVVDHLFPDGEDRSRDVRELAMRVLHDAETDDLKGFVRELSMAIGQPDIPDAVEDVRVMSLHKSKGLSVPITVVAGCVDGLLPRRPGNDLTLTEQSRHQEEQRRLFYVGITRVKADPSRGKPGTLLLTYSQRMPYGEALKAGITPAARRYGEGILHASQFIRELGPAAPVPVVG